MEPEDMHNPNRPLPFDAEFLARRAAGRDSEGMRRGPRSGPRLAVGAPGYLSVRRAAEVLELQPRSVIYLLGKGIIS